MKLVAHVIWTDALLTREMLNQAFRVEPHYFAAAFGVVVTIYYWWYNIKGIHESSIRALRVLQVMTVMVVIMLVWCGVTLLVQGPATAPAATSSVPRRRPGWAPCSASARSSASRSIPASGPGHGVLRWPCGYLVFRHGGGDDDRDVQPAGEVVA